MNVVWLEKFCKQFEDRSACTVSQLLAEEKAGRFALYIPAAAEPDFADLISRIEECLPHIISIASAPYIVIKNEYDVVRTELADSLTPQGIRMTLNDSKQWRLKDGEPRPESVYARNHEDEYNTYENRMVYALIDKVLRILNLPIKNSKEGVRTLYGWYYQSNFLNKLDVLKLVDDDLFKSTDVRAFDDYKKLFYLRGKFSQLRTGSFYKIMSQFPVFAGQPEATNLLIHNADYNACMRLWLFIDKFNAGLSVLTQEEQKSVYSAFIVLAMARSYASLGYGIVRDADVKDVSENFALSGLVMRNDTFSVRLDADTDAVNVLVQCEKLNTQQVTRIGLHTDQSEPFGKDCHFVVSLYRTGYSDRAACVVPGNKSSLRDLDSIVRSTVLSFGADKAVYGKVCLVCGSNMPDDKDYYYRCPDCGAVYSFIDDKTVWINQFSTLEQPR